MNAGGSPPHFPFCGDKPSEVLNSCTPTNLFLPFFTYLPQPMLRPRKSLSVNPMADIPGYIASASIPVTPRKVDRADSDDNADSIE